MSTEEAPSAQQTREPVADGTTAKEPSNQENQDPTQANNLRKMFETESNLFQALDKRDLTEDEQRVIDERVAIQRKMYEEFERRENSRKIRELLEVCPDLSEKEAERALQLCEGREDEAANLLVADVNFRNQIKNPYNPSTAPSAPRNTRQKNTSSRASGPRPKIVDPTTLGDNIFVGVFRGKGFSGTGSTRPTHNARGNGRATRATTTTAEEDEEEEKEVEEEVMEEDENAGIAARTRGGRRRSSIGGGATAAAPTNTTKPSTKKPLQSDTDEEDDIEDVDEEKEATPDEKTAKGKQPVDDNDAGAPTSGKPKIHQLVVETSDGDVRPATETEVKRASRHISAAAPSPAATKETATGRRGSSRPTRAAAAQATAAFVASDDEGDDTNNGAAIRPTSLATMAKKLKTMTDAEAVEWLMRMNATVRVSVLQQLGVDDPIRAVTISCELVGAAENAGGDQQQKKQVGAGGNDNDDGVAPMEEDVAVPQQQQQQQQRQQQPEGGDGAKKENNSDDEDTEMLGAKPAGNTAEAAAQEEDGEEEWGSGGARISTRRTPSSQRKRASGPDSGVGKKARTSDEERGASGDDVAGPSGSGGAAVAPPPAAAVPATRGAGGKRGRARSNAISSRGHTTRGRVKQKSHKSADLVEVGTLRTGQGWFNAGYIFPEGFHSRTLFRSSVSLDSLCVHECYVLGKEGEHWPLPTFKVVAMDRVDEPIIAKSCTGCWSGVLKRINAEIEARRKAGEDLPPPPKTAIAGPEYFGFNQPNIVDAVEALDPEHLCAQYWAGKEDRQAAAAGLPVTTTNTGAAKPPRAPSSRPRAAYKAGGGTGRGRGRRGAGGSDSEHDDDEEGDETAYVSNRWSAVNRAGRYKKRLEDNGEDTTGVDEDNPLPGFMDPITLEEVVRPAISIYGHVMGAATWRAVLAESNNVCPFTKQALKWEQCKVLTKNNIESYKDMIIH